MEKNYNEVMKFLVRLFTNKIPGHPVSKENPFDKVRLEKYIERWGYIDNPVNNDGGGVHLRNLLTKLKEEFGIEVGNIPKKGYYPLNVPDDYDKEWTKEIKKAWARMKSAERIRQNKIKLFGNDIRFSPDKKSEEAYHKFVRTILGTSEPSLDDLKKDLFG